MKSNSPQKTGDAYRPEIYYSIEASHTYKDIAEAVLMNKIGGARYNSVLEVGPGDGHTIDSVVADKKIAIEISEEMASEFNSNQTKLIVGDITQESTVEKIDSGFSLIIAHFVFMEMTAVQIHEAIKNISKLLSPSGVFVFSITNPEAVKDKQFDGAQLVFPEDKDLSKQDVPYTILMDDGTGSYVDVGIRDYYNDLGVYSSALKDANLKFEIEYVRRKQDSHDFAIVFSCTKDIEIEQEM